VVGRQPAVIPQAVDQHGGTDLGRSALAAQAHHFGEGAAGVADVVHEQHGPAGHRMEKSTRNSRRHRR
jgi:hypothetical protein